MKFLIVSFDGLRPDLVSSELTPNILRAQGYGVNLAKQSTVYPSETRVAFPSLVTGSTPDRHGMVGNKFVDRQSVPHRYIDTADAVLLDRLNRESNGGLMTAMTLGEILAKAGRSMAVLATNTPGTTRLFHHKAEDFGHLRVSGHFREACTPTDAVAEMEALFGPLPPAPPKTEPDFEGQSWITSAFLDYVWPRLKPDVSILSYGEPDITSHFHGTGAASTREIIAFCDRQFGRVVDWWEAEGRAADVQLAVISDHGHVTAHSRVSVTEELRSAGFAPGIAPAADVDVVVVPGQVGALYLADRSSSNVARVVEVLTERPWCGPIFTASKNGVEGVAPGSFAANLVFAEHARAPDVYFSYRADDSIDPFGLEGGTYFDSTRRPGLGVHGGLHPRELAAVGLVAGSAFRSDRRVSTTPSSICDIAPTILHLLGLPTPASMSGRVLYETLGALSLLRREFKPEVLQTGLKSYCQELHRVQVDQVTYLSGGYVVAGDVPATIREEAAE